MIHQSRNSRLSRWSTVAGFAIAMAWMESAVVYYLRTMVDRIEPYREYPLPLVGGLGKVELAREAATLLMLLAVGLLAGRTWPGKLAYSAIAFGIWDIFYYLFLKIICDWPRSLLDWDILFLLPLPWWGPVLAPVCIAMLMVIWGTAVIWSGERPVSCQGSLQCWILNAIGMTIALYTFMADALAGAGQGQMALRQLLPEEFNWSLFCLALFLMSSPLIRLLWAGRSGRGAVLASNISA